MMKDFVNGLKLALPIFFGYFAVSFAFGVSCNSEYGMTPLVSILMSFTNMTSSGQFAGMKLIFEGAIYFEIGLTVLLINLRYALMSISLSQHLADNTKTYQRLIFGFGITDEVFGVAIKEKKPLTAKFMYGLVLLPLLGWTLGTACGFFFSNMLPGRVINALGISLYAMFIAIIMPDCRKKLSVLLVVLLAASLQVMFYYVPCFSKITLGFQIIIVTVVASLFGAIMFPIKEDEANVSSN